MATIDNKGKIRGTAGSVVYRVYRDKNIVQGKARKVKQSGESIKASTEFGLSSSAAAVIRRAFEDAYMFRDGEAASRTTQWVYRSIRNSTLREVGKRDLHDADPGVLKGLEFNTNTKLFDMISPSSICCEAYNKGVHIKLNIPTPMSALKKRSRISRAADLFRIRLTLIGFNFRKEYYEYLGICDIDLRSRDSLYEKIISFDCGHRPDLLMMVSMSLLLYKETNMSEGLILLNSRAFSPCAIVAVFPAEAPGDYPDGPVNHDFFTDRTEEGRQLFVMGYDGNNLLRRLPQRLKTCRKTVNPPKPEVNHKHGMMVGRRVSFR